MSTFYIRTYGCQMNERDSEALACLLREHGFGEAPSENAADVLLFNTCSVRDQAERKVLGKVGLLKRAKRQRPGLVIGVIGCMAQNYGRDLLDKLPHVDLVVGPDQLHEIPQLIENVRQGHQGLVRDTQTTETSRLPAGHAADTVSAYVAVMRGCNQFCSYCIVPYTRGRERSRPVPDVVREVSELAGRGTREVVLLGQNITAYGVAESRAAGRYDPDRSPFAKLLEAVHGVEGIERIRFLSPHVQFMNEEFVKTVCSLPKVCNALHVPIQSGSDRILELMGRRYSASDIRRVVRSLRDQAPDMALSTDVIVGFPSETAEDFEATRDLMRDMALDMAYVFRYSPRSGTKAARRYPDDVPDEIKRERNQILLDDLEQVVAARNQAWIGRDADVLLEGPSKRNAERWQGRSRTNKVVIVAPTPEVKPGDVVTVRIQRATAHSLFGEITAISNEA